MVLLEIEKHLLVITYLIFIITSISFVYNLNLKCSNNGLYGDFTRKCLVAIIVRACFSVSFFFQGRPGAWEGFFSQFFIKKEKNGVRF